MRCPAVVAGLAALLPSMTAQADTSCPIPVDRQINSVRKFAPIASFLTREPRCVNCHGGVNPFISGTGPDPADETAPASTSAHGGGRIVRQRETAPDGTQLIEGECIDCHNNMAPRRDGSRSLWMTAPGFLSFVDKDAPTLCKQIKRSSHTAQDFLGHLKDDNGGNNFSGTAFNGDRGLDPETFDIPAVPPSISHAALMRLGQDWVDAMGGSFQGDETCGCEVTLEGKFTYTDASSNDSIKVTGELVWKSKAEDQASPQASGGAGPMIFKPTEGEITVEVDFNNPGVDGSVCKGNGRKTFPVDRLTRGALRHMALEIADDGRYQVTLVIPDTPDPFPAWEFQSACIWPNVTSTQQVPVHHVSVVLGKQEGVIDEHRGIAGELTTPIRRGPRTITGSWSFDSESTR